MWFAITQHDHQHVLILNRFVPPVLVRVPIGILYQYCHYYNPSLPFSICIILTLPDTKTEKIEHSQRTRQDTTIRSSPSPFPRHSNTRDIHRRHAIIHLSQHIHITLEYFSLSFHDVVPLTFQLSTRAAQIGIVFVKK